MFFHFDRKSLGEVKDILQQVLQKWKLLPGHLYYNYSACVASPLETGS